jgi:hypothetical protein
VARGDDWRTASPAHATGWNGYWLDAYLASVDRLFYASIAAFVLCVTSMLAP